MSRRLQPPSRGDSREQQAAACVGLPCSSSSRLTGAEGPGNWARLGQEEQRQAANSCWEPTEPISRAPLPSRPRLRTQEQQEHETNPGSYRYGAASPEPRRAELAAPCWKFLLHKTSHSLESLNLTAERAAYGREGNSLLPGTAAWRRLLTQLQSTEGSWGQPSISWLIAADRGDHAGKHRASRWLRPREGTGVPPGAGNRTPRQRLSRRLFLQGKIFRRLLLCSRISLHCHFHEACVEGSLLGFVFYLRRRSCHCGQPAPPGETSCQRAAWAQHPRKRAGF